MYKVVTTFRDSGVQTEIGLKDYSTAFDLAEKIKKLGGVDVIVKLVIEKNTTINGGNIESIETTTFETDKDGFSKYIMNRFTRRD